MPTRKSATITLRIDPAIKEGLRLAAEREHRSITNMVEVLVRDYCRRQRIDLGISQSSSVTTVTPDQQGD